MDDGGKCIPKSWLCDGVSDCRHSDDEDRELCSELVSDPTLNQNKTGNDLVLEYVCLGPYTSDAKKSSGALIPLAYPRQVIPRKWICDGEQDCPKGDDEKFCDPPYPAKKVLVNETTIPDANVGVLAVTSSSVITESVINATGVNGTLMNNSTFEFLAPSIASSDAPQSTISLASLTSNSSLAPALFTTQSSLLTSGHHEVPGSGN